MASDKNSLSHTKWNCKYHIVFAPKYRRKIIYGELKRDIGKILRQLCEWKEISIIEAELYVDGRFFDGLRSTHCVQDAAK